MRLQRDSQAVAKQFQSDFKAVAKRLRSDRKMILKWSQAIRKGLISNFKVAAKRFPSCCKVFASDCTAIIHCFRSNRTAVTMIIERLQIIAKRPQSYFEGIAKRKSVCEVIIQRLHSDFRLIPERSLNDCRLL
jgi:hypothetical protein